MEHQKNLSKIQSLMAERGVNPEKRPEGYQDYIESKEKTTKVGLFGRTLMSEGSMHLALGRARSVKNFKI